MTHILHIRKTGGSAVRDALGPVAASHGLHLPGHDVRLSDVPLGEGVVFTVRDPLTRFCSGFYSRLRCGRPRNDQPWTAAEARVFACFQTPSALAEGLASPDPALVSEAEAAMEAIAHLAPLGAWLGEVEQLRVRGRDIVMIMWQPALEIDFARLKAKLRLPAHLTLPLDDVGAHRNPAGYDRRLTPLARDVLRRRYQADYRLYAACLDIRAARAREASGR